MQTLQTFLEWEESKTEVIILPHKPRVLFPPLCNPSHLTYITELEESEESNGDAQKYGIISLNGLLVN